MLSFRKSASTTAAVHGYLSDGTRVNVIGESGNFYKIQHGGKEGYGTKDYIKKVATSSGGGTTSPPTTNPPSNSNAVTAPAGSEIQRGTPSQYLSKGIGWPLGKASGSSVVQDKSVKKITSNFGPRTGANSPHLGIDLVDGSKTNSSGIPILAVCDGMVIKKAYDSTSRGNYITIVSYIEDPVTHNPLIFTYMHMKNAALVNEEDEVVKGQKIGEVGNTGATSAGAHLHFECSNYTGAFTYKARTVTGSTPLIKEQKQRAYNRVNPEFFYPAGSFTYNTDTDGIWNEQISQLNANGS
jgi:murein DD-endopeptidase MepM/ murein hydrolase activator NlpD